MGSGCCKTEEVYSVNMITHRSKAYLSKSQNPLDNSSSAHEISFLSTHHENLPPIKWQRGALIGQGVYGKVYQALNLETGELLAIKTSKLSSNKKKAQNQLRKIKQELGILKKLNHPNIIKYFQADYCNEKNYVDIILEYIPSGSMNDLLCRYKSFPEPVVRNYTKQLLDGLDYLHSNSIVHRDIKSANVLVTEFSVLKLSDFGCSRRFDSENDFHSRSFKGSPY